MSYDDKIIVVHLVDQYDIGQTEKENFNDQIIGNMCDAIVVTQTSLRKIYNFAELLIFQMQRRWEVYIDIVTDIDNSELYHFVVVTTSN